MPYGKEDLQVVIVSVIKTGLEVGLSLTRTGAFISLVKEKAHFLMDISGQAW